MSRGYCFTMNNYTDDDYRRLLTICRAPRPIVTHWVLGKEIAPTTGTPHIQGFIYFKNVQPIASVIRLISGAHIEPMKGTPIQASDYCKKSGEYETGGECPENGRRTDLEEVYRMVNDGMDLDDIVLQNPDAYNRAHRVLHRLEDIQLRRRKRTDYTQGEWIYGTTGTGKSEYAFSHENAYAYPYDNGWWDGYRQQETVVIDEFRGQLPFNELLRMVDKHPNYFVRRRCREPMPFNSKKVIITSSLPPWVVYGNLMTGDSLEQLFRRFEVFELVKDESGEVLRVKRTIRNTSGNR